MKIKHLILTPILILGAMVWSAVSVHAATAAELDHDSRMAVMQLYQKNPKALEIARHAVAALVFPNIVKAGFLVGAQGGDGALLTNHSTLGFYNTTSVSYGLQAGVQKFGYVLFFMNHQALSYLDESGGWELGVGPSLVIVDAGMAKTMSTTTLNKDIYAFIFNQKGLMGGLGLQGTKISRYKPSR